MIHTIFDDKLRGKSHARFPIGKDEGVLSTFIPPEMLRTDESLDLPDVPEIEVVRHYIKLSRNNYGVDNGTYPLGSCTMKYNPKINESLSNLNSFKNIHPLQPLQDSSSCQGYLQVMHELDLMLSRITGMDHFTLQPAAGAHGEFTGMLIIWNYLKSKGLEKKKNKIIVPDTAHGTNPASATACNFEIIEISSGADGLVNLDELKAALQPGDVAGIMLTNPNTLGLFEENILEITRIVHEAGGLCYYDGANLNGLCGICRPGDMGFDIIHLNLHKTFSTPHGGGGPGSGPVGVKKFLKEFLPGDRITKEGNEFQFKSRVIPSKMNIKSFHGNMSVLLKAYFYIKTLGLDGLARSTRIAVLNANYVRKHLASILNIPYNRSCYHEFVANDKNFPNDITTEDIAKRMLDHGIHAPTIYFPLIVHGALMIEPTETESLQRLNKLIDVFEKIKKEASETPDLVLNAPLTTPVGRLEQVQAAREPILTQDMHDDFINRNKKE
ncbi:MAG: aminomethyl-transferring glycine dehydrogenase subunit GcvPB [Promethearchaeota archaeon]